MRNDYYNDSLLKEVSSCQRNFDQSKPIESEKMAILDEWASKPPQQTGTLNCTVIKITNLDCTIHLSKLLRGKATYVKDKIYQPQIHGNVCYVWTAPSGPDGGSDFASGFESGLLAVKATMLGLKCGFARCGLAYQPVDQSPEFNQWKHMWGIDHKKHNRFLFAMGIGYPLEDKPYYWSESYVGTEGNEHYHNKPNWVDLTVID